MNRQQRRQAARDSRRAGVTSEVDCGCTTRRLVPVGSADCPACGQPSFLDPDGIEWPTTAPFGSVAAMEVGCACGEVYGVDCLVD